MRRKAKFLEGGNDWCPLCTETMAMESATLEHVPPQCVGNEGQGNCLTCKTCNSAWGRKAEAWMGRMYRGDGLVQFKDSAGKLVMSNDATFAGTSWTLRPGKLPKTPRPISDTVEILVFPPRKRDEMVTKAWVKSAFLAAGCATQGEAWRADWAGGIREYLDLNTSSPRPEYAWAIDIRKLKANPPSILEHRVLFKAGPTGFSMLWGGMYVGIGVGLQDSPSREGYLYHSVNGAVRLPAFFGEDNWSRDE